MERAKLPVDGGDETNYLDIFLDQRRVAMKAEPAHEDTSRVDTIQRSFLRAGNLSLSLPLGFQVYNTPYEISYIDPAICKQS